MAELVENLIYCPLTGIVVNKHGNEVGWIEQQGYRCIRIAGRIVKLHRIIYETFIDPLGDLFVDHIDHDKTNNRLDNLRAATKSQNAANRSTIYKGVDRRPSGRYRARIKVQGKHICLGTYDTEEEANASYLKARKTYFGEFDGLS